MNRRCGVIFIDEAEIIFRIYETSDREWKLFHYHSSLLPSQEIQIKDILEIVGDFFSTSYAEHIADWKICSRQHPKKFIREIAQALSISIEDISLHREQELICKGMFTELW